MISFGCARLSECEDAQRLSKRLQCACSQRVLVRQSAAIPLHVHSLPVPCAVSTPREEVHAAQYLHSAVFLNGNTAAVTDVCQLPRLFVCSLPKAPPRCTHAPSCQSQPQQQRRTGQQRRQRCLAWAWAFPLSATRRRQTAAPPAPPLRSAARRSRPPCWRATRQHAASPRLQDARLLNCSLTLTSLAASPSHRRTAARAMRRRRAAAAAGLAGASQPKPTSRCDLLT